MDNPDEVGLRPFLRFTVRLSGAFVRMDNPDEVGLRPEARSLLNKLMTCPNGQSR